MKALDPGIDDPLALVGTALGGRFRIERRVAEGGFGVVYRAEQVALGRSIALKIFKTDSRDPAFGRAFQHEATTIARLKHPNIVDVHDFGSSEGPSGAPLHWMALEWLEGRTLADLLANERAQGLPPRDPARALELLRPVIEGVAFAHRQGVAHRDLKPDNIFLAEASGIVRPKVLDFGIAQIAAGNAHRQPSKSEGGGTTELPAAFSPDYAAPEQVSYGRTGPWTDVHALGLILTEVLTGTPPYPADAEARFAAVTSERRPTPGGRGVVVGAWESVLEKALARRPGERYQDAGQLLEALAGPIKITETMPPAPPARSRRRRLLAALLTAGSAAIALVAFLAWPIRDPGAGAPGPGQIMLAVMPFQNLTGDRQHEYLSDGLTDGMIGQLGRLMPERLAVIARSSVVRFKGTSKSAKEVGRELGVGYLLESSVSQVDDRIRVTIHLIRTADEIELWSESYDRPIREVMGLQTDMALAVARGIRLKLGGREANALAGKRPVKPAAYQAYLRARYSTGSDLTLSSHLRMAAFEEAIKLDPDFAPAHAGLASSALAQSALEAPSADLGPRGKAAAQRAIELDEQLPAAHAALGAILLNYDWDWPGAERHLRRAMELDPNDPDILSAYGQLCVTAGRFAEGVALRSRAAELDPLSLTARWHVGAAYYHGRQYQKAIVAFRQTLALDATVVPARSHMAHAHLELGEFPEAIEQARVILQGTPGTRALAGAGYVLARAGRQQEALAVLDRVTEIGRNRYVAPLLFARLNLGLGRHDEALAWLEKSYQERESDLIFLAVNPIWDPLRGDPRFADLVRRVGIPTVRRGP